MAVKPIRSIGDVPGALTSVDTGGYRVKSRGLVSITFDDAWLCQNTYAVPLLDERGIKASFAVVSDWLDTTVDGEAVMTGAQVKALYDSGHEICNHSKTHPTFSTVTDPEAIRAEVDGCDTALRALGVTPSDVFVLPWGDAERTNQLMGVLREKFAGFRNIYGGTPPRGIHNIIGPEGRPFVIRSTSIHSNDTLQQVKDAVKLAETYGCWVVLTFHHVSPTLAPPASLIWFSEANFGAVLDYVQTLDVDIVSLSEGLRYRTRKNENLVIGGDNSIDIMATGIGQNVGLGMWYSNPGNANVTDTYDTTTLYNGHKSRKFTYAGSTGITDRFEVQVKPWHDYTITCAVKTASVTGNGIRVGIYQHGYSSWVTGTADWQLVTFTFNAGPNFRLWLEINSAASAGSCWWTDLCCFETLLPRTESKELTNRPRRVVFQANQADAVLFEQGEVWHSTTDKKLRMWNGAVRERIVSVNILTAKTVNTARTTIAHGLGYTPTIIIPLMTSAGMVYRDGTIASDATNIYMKADADGRTCDLYVG